MRKADWIVTGLALVVVLWLVGGAPAAFPLIRPPAMLGRVLALAPPGRVLIRPSLAPLDNDRRPVGYGPVISFERLVDPRRPMGEP